jgi:predicted ATPase
VAAAACEHSAVSPHKPYTGVIGSPFLTQIALDESRVADDSRHPFNLRSLHRGLPLRLTKPVTMLVGENGAGKSTLLEAIAWACGFDAESGERRDSCAEAVDGHALGRALDFLNAPERHFRHLFSDDGSQ